MVSFGRKLVYPGGEKTKFFCFHQCQRERSGRIGPVAVLAKDDLRLVLATCRVTRDAAETDRRPGDRSETRRPKTIWFEVEDGQNENA